MYLVSSYFVRSSCCSHPGLLRLSSHCVHSHHPGLSASSPVPQQSILTFWSDLFKTKVESSHSSIQYLTYLVSLRAKTQIITMTYKVSNETTSSIWPNLFISLLFTLLQIPWLLIQDIRYVSPPRALVLAVLYPRMLFPQMTTCTTF